MAEGANREMQLWENVGFEDEAEHLWKLYALPGVDVQLEPGHVGPAPGDTRAPAQAEQGADTLVIRAGVHTLVRKPYSTSPSKNNFSPFLLCIKFCLFLSFLSLTFSALYILPIFLFPFLYFPPKCKLHRPEFFHLFFGGGGRVFSNTLYTLNSTRYTPWFTLKTFKK